MLKSFINAASDTVCRPAIVRRSGFARGCVLIAASAGVIACFAVVSPAFADGSGTISGAPVVTYGVQEFGNTATGSATPNDPRCENAITNGTSYRSFWALPVTAGDRVAVDWESEASATSLAVFPVGTTDFNFYNENPVTEQSLAANGKNQLTFTASVGGTMPLDYNVCSVNGNGTPGPYDFTAYVSHRVIASLREIGRSRRRRRSYLSLRTVNTGGVPITSGLSAVVQIQKRGRWETLGSLGQSAFGSFSIHWQSSLVGKHINVKTVVSGAGYLTTSATIKITAA